MLDHHSYPLCTMNVLIKVYGYKTVSQLSCILIRVFMQVEQGAGRARVVQGKGYQIRNEERYREGTR